MRQSALHDECQMMDPEHPSYRRRHHSSQSNKKATVMLCLAGIALLQTSHAMVTSRVTSPLSPSSASNARALVDTAMLLRKKKLNANDDNESSSPLEDEVVMARGSGLFGTTPSKRPSTKPARPSSSSPQTNNLWTATLFDEEDRQALEDLSLLSRVQETVPSVTNLQTATGTEIPDMELHLQMEAARNRAAASNCPEGAVRNAASASAFVEEHVKDATSFEKLAMMGIPLQLPQPAQSAWKSQQISTTEEKKSIKTSSGTQVSSAGIKTKRLSSVKIKPDRLPVEDYVDVSRKVAKTTKEAKLSSSRTTNKTKPFQTKAKRVTHEQELQLARIIQQGTELHRIKADFESTHGRDITRTEWTELAKLKSPTQLRKLVSAYRSAKTTLVTANMGLVHAVVRNNYKSFCAKRGISEEELVQEGSLGLIRAAELFDPSRGLRFSTYATIWIKGVLSNSKVTETITLPIREKTKFNKIQRATEDLQKQHASGEGEEKSSYTPTLEELSSVTGLKISEILSVQRRMTHTRNVLSLDYQYESTTRSGGETSTMTEGGLQKDPAFMADAQLFEKLQLRADIIAALVRNLDPREGRLMRLRYGLNDGQSRTIVECAEMMGISQSKAQTLAAGCLRKLREADDAESLQEYLLTVA